MARDIRGIGFRTADQIAAKLGIEKTALIRVRAGISYALAEAMDEGHCGLPTEELTALTGKLLDVSADLIEMALRLELQAGAVVADVLDGRRCVFLAGLYRAEREIAEKLKALSVGSPPCIVNAHRINQGLMPDLAPVESGDFYFVDAADPEDGVRKLLAIVQERIPKRFGPA